MQYSWAQGFISFSEGLRARECGRPTIGGRCPSILDAFEGGLDGLYMSTKKTFQGFLLQLLDWSGAYKHQVAVGSRGPSDPSPYNRHPQRGLTKGGLGFGV